MKFFKLIFTLFLVMSLTLNSQAQTNTNSSTPVLKTSVERSNGDWLLYIEDAYAKSQKTGKPILANFTGSDWCGWCIRLKNEVFKTEAFKTWAKNNVVLLELDYPKRSVLPEDLQGQNGSLQQAFQISGYPTIWVFNLDFNETTKQYSINALGKTGYVAGGAEAWINESNKILKN